MLYPQVMTAPSLGLRERTRRAVQKEITEAAERLFLNRGYEATTIAAVAAETGMSQRSVFRYFPTKEDIVLGKLDFVAEEMLVTLRDPTGRRVGVGLAAQELGPVRTSHRRARRAGRGRVDSACCV